MQTATVIQASTPEILEEAVQAIIDGGDTIICVTALSIKSFYLVVHET